MVLTLLLDLKSQEDEVKFLGELKNDLDGISGASGSAKTFSFGTHRVRCIVRQTRIAANHSSEFSRGTFQSCSLSQDLIQGIYLVLSFLSLGQKLKHGRGILFLLPRKFINSQLSDSIRLLTANSSLFLNILTISCVMFFGRVCSSPLFLQIFHCFLF